MEDRFTFDGRRRLGESDEFQKALVEIREKVEAKFADELRNSSRLRRWWLCGKMEREILAEWNALFPKGAMYFSNQ